MLSLPLHTILALCINDAKVITCSASSAIKWQVHSTLINAEACTPAISGHERWNVLTAAPQNKHTAVRAWPAEKHTTWAKICSHFFEFNDDKIHKIKVLCTPPQPVFNYKLKW